MALNSSRTPGVPVLLAMRLRADGFEKSARSPCWGLQSTGRVLRLWEGDGQARSRGLAKAKLACLQLCSQPHWRRWETPSASHTRTHRKAGLGSGQAFGTFYSLVSRRVSMFLGGSVH